MLPTKLFFVLEGNIGAGKSTFLKILKQYLNIQEIYEPLERWQNIDGESIFDYFYKDPNRWAYTFQTYAFVTRMQVLENKISNTNHQISISERSIYSDRYCFAKNCYEMGMINPLEWKLYKDLFNSATQISKIKPAGFIYMQTNPETCYQRILKRNRLEEAGVSLNYLKLLHEKHENWLINKNGIDDYLKNIPVLTIKCDEEFINNIDVIKKYVLQIADFLYLQYSIPQERILNPF